jgi:hypothetical protein
MITLAAAKKRNLFLYQYPIPIPLDIRTPPQKALA